MSPKKLARVARVEATLVVLADLLNGKEHDRRSIAERVDVAPAAADRQMLRLVRHVPGVVREKRGKHSVIRFHRATLEAKASPPARVAVIAASLGASLAPLFRGSSYEKGMRDAVDYLVGQARNHHRIKDADRKFYFARQGGEIAIADRHGDLDDLIDAVASSQPVTIDYTHLGGRLQKIRVEPLAIVLYLHQLYVLGRSDEHAAYPYRLARISAVERHDETFAYPTRTEFDPDQVFQKSFGIFLSDSVPIDDVKVRLTGAWAPLYAETHRWHVSQRTERAGDDVILHLHVKTCPELTAFILGFGPDAEVLEPERLRDDIAVRAKRMAERYAAPPAPPSPRPREAKREDAKRAKKKR
jgi:hypothetical protein